MPIRSIDFQVMIPKTTEVQKIKHAEVQNPQNNNTISMHKQLELNQKSLQKVNETKKAYESKIRKDQQRKQQQNNQQEDAEEKNRKDKRRNKATIDIRI